MFGEKKEAKSEREELEGLNAVVRDSKWFGENFDEFKRRFEGKIIAVKDEKIFSVGDDIQELCNKIEGKREDPCWIYISSIPPKDVVFIL
jgi:hypothetical protein